MLSLNIVDRDSTDLIPVFKRIRAAYSTGIPFYNTLTSRVEVSTKPMRGIYSPSILLYGYIRYSADVKHIMFMNSIKSKPRLRPYQIAVYEMFNSHYNWCISKGYPCSALIQAPCGFGKSETSLRIIADLSIKTVIIVKTKILVNHWCSYFENYGISHLGSYDGATSLLKKLVEERLPDVLVIVSRHIENEDFVQFLLSNYSLCLIDEVHSWALCNHSEMSKFIITNPFPVTIFLTATPNKLDLPVLGKIIKAEHPPSFKNLQREIHVYSNIDTTAVTVEEISNDEPLDPIQGDRVRNQIIVTCILDNLLESSIVYCNRRRHVELLYNSTVKSLSDTSMVEELVTDNITTTFKIRGTEYTIMKGDAEHSDIHSKIKSLSNCPRFVLITTVQFCACGLDLPSVNTIMLALTSIDDNTLKQAVGRAERGPYTGTRKVYLFCTTYNTGIERTKQSSRFKPLAYHNHSSIQYTAIYNKFLRDYKSIKTTLTVAGWNDTSRKTTLRRFH